MFLKRCIIFLLPFIMGGGICAGIWLSETWERRRADAYYAQYVGPAEAALRRDLDTFLAILERRKRGESLPIPPMPAASDSLIAHRMIAQDLKHGRPGAIELHHALIPAGGILPLILIALGWSWHERHRARPDRPIAPGAGKQIARIAQHEGVFVARFGCDHAATGIQDQDIEVDVRQRAVTFHGFAFIASFFRNPRRDRVKVPFADILGTRMVLRGRHWNIEYLEIRTTQGRLELLPRDYENYEELSALLADIVEVNRKSPARYREALAREPFKHTPWYGWLILALALAGAMGWFLASL